MRKFYRYRQNNSGGDFIVDRNVSIENYIEANSAVEANEKAEELGIYFDGCEKGLDCNCCGDRWYEQYDYDDALEFETIDELVDYAVSPFFTMWTSKHDIVVHMDCGVRAHVTVTQPNRKENLYVCFVDTVSLGWGRVSERVLTVDKRKHPKGASMD